ncbi:ADP-heptose:LPS heptosyltransferase [Chitinophaga costaii]|uniref:ADP-heptose:LPS heptosyltransferase n=1 Tax=Chitinophaga costaii TaxID=1335309 RepID=A0A1C3ZN24_9BACT|nr:glycosyltransferase family 9 protein [Chitinophaga costaii]PUZ30441.1 lipopolysaccharide heptosyltransferase family protein [Chitinophaga costaii]SCB83728.1 ADP-heptose:LPS heptosyltransferase [Chitinophaga costaii]
MQATNKPFTLLAIRLSALGDAAMTIPVIREMLAANPQLEIVLVTNQRWLALGEGISRLHLVGADVKGRHKGVPGLFRLFREIRQAYRIHAVADLHGVLRARILRTFFALSGKKIAVIDKGRAGKKALTRPDHKIFQPQKTTVQRYRDVFAQLGVGGITVSPIRNSSLAASMLQVTGSKEPGQRWVGIAPFATYREKMYPLAKMEAVMNVLSTDANTRVFLFGGGPGEIQQLAALAEDNPNTVCVAGKFSLSEELAMMEQLDVMVSMDSANMHLASLRGTAVVSVWGATHPYAGFMGYGQPAANAVQISLACRPCSVFGNKPCYRGDHACMEWLEPMQVVERVRAVLLES